MTTMPAPPMHAATAFVPLRPLLVMTTAYAPPIIATLQPAVYLRLSPAAMLLIARQTLAMQTSDASTCPQMPFATTTTYALMMYATL